MSSGGPQFFTVLSVIATFVSSFFWTFIVADVKTAGRKTENKGITDNWNYNKNSGLYLIIFQTSASKLTVFLAL